MLSPPGTTTKLPSKVETVRLTFPPLRLRAQIRTKLTGLRNFSNCPSVTRACG
jgi:hypothetical protein